MISSLPLIGYTHFWDAFSIGGQVLAKDITLYDYELIVGEHGGRLVAFGEYAGRAGMINFLRGLGERTCLPYA